MESRAFQLHEALLRDWPGLQCCGAESCTGGSVSAALTSVPGSSSWFWGGLVVYANEAKSRLINVPASIIAEHGAVSHETVHALLDGLEALLPSSLRFAVSGVAGPGGGSPGKPVGTVVLGTALGARTLVRTFHFDGDRAGVRAASTVACIDQMLEILAETKLDRS